MAYNLPPFWSPGYALPSNVRVEDLQRGTFTTRQQPRGSYDDPTVGDGGYAVPNYVLNTPYGQGALVTKWMPRGTVGIPVPHYLQKPPAQILAQTKASGDGTNYEIGPAIQSVHAGATDPFTSYGKKVADQVLSSVQALPKQHRKNAMRALFDKIDPRLFNRVQATASKAARAGLPPQRALHHAIATEFRGGMLRELHAIGTTGRVKTASQVGLGCWGCAAVGMGDDTTAPMKVLRGAGLMAVAVDTTPAVGSWQRIPVAGAPAGAWTACGYYWVGTGNPLSGPTTTCPPVRTGGTGSPTGQQKLPPCGSLDANGNAIAPCDATGTAGFAGTVTVGPFTFSVGGGGTGTGTVIDNRNSFTSPTQLSQAQHDWLVSKIKGHVAHDPDNGKYAILQTWFPDGDGQWYSSAQTIDSDYKSSNGGLYPVNPIEGNIDTPSGKYGVFLFICGANCDGGQPMLRLAFAPMSAATFTGWSQAGSAIGGFVQGVAGAIGDLGCALLKNPFAGTAAAAASGGAAAAGTQIGANICGGGQGPGLPPPPPPPVGGIGWGTIAAVGGGLALVYLMTHKHKHRGSRASSTR